MQVARKLKHIYNGNIFLILRIFFVKNGVNYTNNSKLHIHDTESTNIMFSSYAPAFGAK